MFMILKHTQKKNSISNSHCVRQLSKKHHNISSFLIIRHIFFTPVLITKPGKRSQNKDWAGW